ncbi:RagB/SusD family nutrient uptake outer membrane protein [Sinomicrobium sp.]
MKKYLYLNIFIWGAFLSLLLVSCDSFLDADSPIDAVPEDEVFQSDATATSAVNGLYARFMGTNTPTLMFNGGIGVMTGLGADEIHDFDGEYQDYENNEIIYTEFGPVVTIWTTTYEMIYHINACIKGLEGNTLITPDLRDDLLGQAYFIRALSYFYMTNLYGPLPIVTETEYEENRLKSRSPSSEVYELILSDLSKAETLMKAPDAQNIRANLNAVLALDARVQLYLEEYENAADRATSLIEASYGLDSLDQVFKRTSVETIWQVDGVLPTYPNTFDAYFYSPEVGGVPSYTVTDDLLDSFEDGDKRKEQWIGSYKYIDSVTYYYPNKYTQIYDAPATESNVIFRLAEQYLIRAEARAHLGDLDGAASDLNEIRKRAGLKDYDGAVEKIALLEAIAHENRIEFFSEWGHRWFDLKRTGKIDEVMTAFKPGVWKNTAHLWPIPQTEINKNPNLLPNNDGY